MEEYDYRITWSTHDHDHREHSVDWYWAVGIVSISLAVAFVILHNTLLSIIILLGVGILVSYTKHPPRVVEYEFSKRGVRAGEVVYPWDSLDSYWVLERQDTPGGEVAPKLLLISKKQLMPHIVIPLTDEVLDEVHQAVSHMLHEEFQIEPFHDRIMRKIGF